MSPNDYEANWNIQTGGQDHVLSQADALTKNERSTSIEIKVKNIPLHFLLPSPKKLFLPGCKYVSLSHNCAEWLACCDSNILQLYQQSLLSKIWAQITICKIYVHELSIHQQYNTDGREITSGYRLIRMRS